jgi:hypothetical protein
MNEQRQSSCISCLWQFYLLPGARSAEAILSVGASEYESGRSEAFQRVPTHSRVREQLNVQFGIIR